MFPKSPIPYYLLQKGQTPMFDIASMENTFGAMESSLMEIRRYLWQYQFCQRMSWNNIHRFFLDRCNMAFKAGTPQIQATCLRAYDWVKPSLRQKDSAIRTEKSSKTARGLRLCQARRAARFRPDRLPPASGRRAVSILPAARDAGRLRLESHRRAGGRVPQSALTELPPTGTAHPSAQKRHALQPRCT